MKTFLQSFILVTILLTVGGCAKDTELETIRSEVRANQSKTAAAIDALQEDIQAIAAIAKAHERELQELTTAIQSLKEKIAVSRLTENTRLDQIEQDTKRIRLDYVLLESNISTKAEATSVAELELAILAIKQKLEKVERSRTLHQLSLPVRSSD